MPDLIVTLPDLKRYLRHNTDADDLQLTGALVAAHQLVWSETDRTFTAPADPPAAETRYYPMPNGPLLSIDDIVDDTDLTVAVVDGDTFAASAYQLEPRTRRPGWPFTSIRFLAGTATVPRFDLDWWWRSPSFFSAPQIAVTSTRWGWEASPALASEAIKIVAKNIWNYRTTSFGAQVLPGDVAVMVAGDPQVEAMLKDLKRGSVKAPGTINVGTSL